MLNHYICNNCGRSFPFLYEGSRLFCSPECDKEYYQVTLQCDACGKLFTMGYSVLRSRVKRGYQHFYCCRSCKGRNTGQKYGFGVHPENRSGGYYNGQPSKWAKFIPQIKEMLRQREYLSNIMKELGIPKGSYLLIKKIMAENL